MELIENGVQYGTVIAAGDPLSVMVDDERVEVARAVSLLVVPEAGDRVVVATGPDERRYVVAILERPSGAPLIISLGDDATLTGGRVAMEGKRLELTGEEGKGTFGSFALTTSRLSIISGAVDTLVKVANVVADRLTRRSKESVAVVEGHDSLEAGSASIDAEGILDLSGADAQLTATGVARVDGAQIHIG